MALGRLVHFIGMVCALLGCGLLIVCSISAPLVNDIGLMKVTLRNSSDIRNTSVVFGPFGFCVLDVAPPQTDQDRCPRASIGYIPAQEMRLLDESTVWRTWTGHNLDLMTVSFILFPIAAGFAFFAVFFAFCGVIGKVLAAFLAFMGWACALGVMIVAFVAMGDLLTHVQAAGLQGTYGIAMWASLAAMIVMFFAALLLFFSCCSGISRRRKEGGESKRRSSSPDTHPRAESPSSFNRRSMSEKRFEATAAGAGMARSSVGENRTSGGYGVADSEKRHSSTYGAAALGSEKHQSGGYDEKRYESEYSRSPTAVASVPFRSASRKNQHHLKDTLRGGAAPAAAAGAHRPVSAGSPVNAQSQSRSPPGYNPAAVNPNGSTRNLAPGETVTQHLPTTTTTTAVVPDSHGGYDTDMKTTQHDPTIENTRSNAGTPRSVSRGAGQAAATTTTTTGRLPRYKEDLS